MEHEDFKVEKKNGHYLVKKKISFAKLNTPEPEESTSTGEINERCQEKTKATKGSYRIQLVNTITYLICALLNSGGGELELESEKVLPSPRKQISELIRTVEQKISGFVDCVTLSSNIIWTICPLSTCDKIVVNVKNPDHDRLFTMDYNFFLPTRSQVEAVPSCQWHSQQFIKIILSEEKDPQSTVTRIGSHHTSFTQGEVTDLFESETVQFKNLKSAKSKNTSLADRITGKNNKFAKYVSAFANHSGGHIYFGIEDNGKIIGEELDSNDKSEIIKKIRKAINSMIWPGGKPREGKHWKVDFVPVQGAKSGTFVVVFFVARCRRGAFVDKPECCHIVEDYPEPKVQDMDFATWRERLFYPYQKSQNQIIRVPNTIGRCSWSSRKQCIFVSLHDLLQSLINNGSWKEFDRQANKASQESEDDGKLFILSKKINASIRKGNFRKAEKDSDMYDQLMPSSPNANIFEVIKLYLNLVEARCQGKYRDCYKIAQDGIEKVATIPISFLTASFFAITGTVAAILASEEEDERKAKKLLTEAESHFATTLQHSNRCCENAATSGSVIDIEKKAYINLALLKLGITLSGNILRNRITDKEMNEAHSLLNEVNKLERDSCQKCRFREIQEHFTEAGLQYRLSQREKGEQQHERLKKAYLHSTHAWEDSRKCRFEEMALYTRKLTAFLAEMLVCSKLAEIIKIHKEKRGSSCVQDYSEKT